MEKPRRSFGRQTGQNPPTADGSRREEDDYIVPRSGYYFEHDDRDVWQPRRGGRQGFARGQGHRSSERPSYSSYPSDRPTSKRDRSEAAEPKFRPYQIYEQARKGGAPEGRNEGRYHSHDDRTYNGHRSHGGNDNRKPHAGDDPRKSHGGDDHYKSHEDEDHQNGHEPREWNASGGSGKRLRSKIEHPTPKPALRSKIEAPAEIWEGKKGHEDEVWETGSKRRRFAGFDDSSRERSRNREEWNSDRDQRGYASFGGQRGARSTRGQSDRWPSYSGPTNGRPRTRTRAPSPDVWKHDMFEEINKEPTETAADADANANANATKTAPSRNRTGKSTGDGATDMDINEGGRGEGQDGADGEDSYLAPELLPEDDTTDKVESLREETAVEA